MLKFHCCIHRASNNSPPQSKMQFRGFEIKTVALQNPWEPLPVSFDEATNQLRLINGLHFEMDGWFIWGHGSGDDRWQVDGQLTDGGDRLEFVEMKGDCPEESFDQLLAAFGSRQSPLTIQLIQEGIFVDVETMKQVSAT